MQHWSALIKAQVGAAKYSENVCLTLDAETHCNIIADQHFWQGLKQVIGDIEPIYYGTNINQKDSTCPDQVLMTFIGWHVYSFQHSPRA